MGGDHYRPMRAVTRGFYLAAFDALTGVDLGVGESAAVVVYSPVGWAYSVMSGRVWLDMTGRVGIRIFGRAVV